MDKITAIKKRLVKKATNFTTGGFRPTNSNTESWIGRVYLYKEDEEIPTDNNGKLMIPLFQVCLESLPYVPASLQDTKVLTIFASADIPMDLVANGDNWLIREYKMNDVLVVKDLVNKASFVKPFPLKSQLIEEDYPVWDGGGIPAEIESELLEMEKSGEITDYFDYVEINEGHKIGGYPNFIQSGIDFGEGYEFLLQIASDEKANLEIVDSGNMYFAKNSQTGDWKLYCDFY